MQTPKTTLWIPPHIYSQLMFYAWKVDAEVGGYGRLSFDTKENDIFVHELFLVKQEVHQTECNLKADGTATLYQELIDKGEPEKIGEVSLWWHSHKNMAASFSSVDDELMRTWPGSYLVSLVINRDGSMSATLTTKTPLLVIGKIDVEVDWFDVAEAESWTAELEKKVTKAPPIQTAIVKPVQQQIPNWTKANEATARGRWDSDWDDEYNDWFTRVGEKHGFHSMSEEEWKKQQELEEAEFEAELETWMEEAEELDETERANIRKAIGCG